MLNQKPYYGNPLIATLDPVVVKNSEVFTDVVDMSVHACVTATLFLGDMPAEGIVFRAVACDANGSNPTATLTGKTVTITASATANDGTQYVIQLTYGDLVSIQPTKRYVKFGVTTDAGTGGPAAISVHSHPARYQGGASGDLASVTVVA